jgi:hypothetical protein
MNVSIRAKGERQTGSARDEKICGAKSCRPESFHRDCSRLENTYSDLPFSPQTISKTRVSETTLLS